MEERAHFAFLTLLDALVRVGFQRVEVGFAGAWDEDGSEAIRVRDSEDVFVRTEAESLDSGPFTAPGHVRALGFGMVIGGVGSVGIGAGEEIPPDTSLGAPAHSYAIAVADGKGGARLADKVSIELLVGSDVPNFHLLILARRHHVSA